MLVGILALLLAGCVSRHDGSTGAPAPAAVPLSHLAGLTLQVGDQKGGTESLPRAAGALDGLPYQIAFSTFTSGPPRVEAATAGKIDVAITGNTPPIFGAASNAKVKVVAAYDGGGTGDQMLVHADSPIAFTQRQADAWAIWDPYTAQVAQQVPVRSIAEAERVTNGYWFAIASNQALADPRRNTALADLLARFAKAAQWARAHPREWAEKYAAAVGLDPQVAAVAQGRSLRLPTGLTDDVVASEQRLSDLLAAAGQIQSSPRFADWVDRRFNDSVKPYLMSPS